ncbi:MAG: hypothetical protein QOH50_1640, partial [Kribbellaceae bacterium]|nr:hypothetical protein [Kribbellaceae bacterium]
MATAAGSRTSGAADDRSLVGTARKRVDPSLLCRSAPPHEGAVGQVRQRLWGAIVKGTRTMSEPGANARHRHRRKAPPPGSRVKRPLLAIAVLLLVLAPISWILLQQPNSNETDASIPYVTGGDDRYVTTSNEPVAATSSPVPSPSATPTPDDTTGTPTPTPTHSPTPGKTPTRRPTAGPTSVPTDGHTVAPTDQPTRAGSTLKPTP